MASFKVVGPVEVPTISGKGGKSVKMSGLKQFWLDAGCGDKVGCYVFAIRHGRGTMPHYAGRTAYKFSSECFQHHKLSNYHRALTTVAKGTPVMFFVVLTPTKGPKNTKAIKALEERLIGLGMRRNPNMANIKKVPKDEPVVAGVMGASPGKPSSSASAFRKMIGL